MLTICLSSITDIVMRRRIMALRKARRDARHTIAGSHVREGPYGCAPFFFSSLRGHRFFKR